MKKNSNKLRVKGFTLIELIVVLFIIGVLIGILAPTMSGYYRKSRIKDANADAKMVYNAAQTAAQTFIAQDRVKSDTERAASAIANTLIVSYSPVDGVRFATSFSMSWEDAVLPGDSGYQAGQDDEAMAVANTVLRTVSDSEDICWTVCIQNYIVQGSIAAVSANTNRVGFYTASKAQATDVTNNTYSQWLRDTDGGDVNTLGDVCTVYVNSTPGAPEAEPTT